jgi:hypothetical protein
MTSATPLSSTSDAGTYVQGAGLPAFAARTFPSTAAFVDAMLQFIAAQVGVGSSFLTEINVAQNRNTIFAVYNLPDGCAIPLGAELPLDHTF